MKNHFVRRVIAGILSLLLVMDHAAYASVLPSAKSWHQALSVLPELELPQEFGTVEESFHGNSGKTIVYIQDAHDSLEAQENIAAIVHSLIAKQGVQTVFEEGLEGRVPSDEYFGFISDPAVKQKVSYFLMDHLRLGGAEYAHVNRAQDFKLLGIDSVKLHHQNIEAYRESTKYVQDNNKDLKALHRELEKLANRYFPNELKEWMKIRAKRDKEELSFLDYLKRTQQLFLKEVSLEKFQSDFPNLSILFAADRTQDKKLIDQLYQALDYKVLFSEIHRLEDQYAQSHLNATPDQQIFKYYKMVQLLTKLNRIELTSEEYEVVQGGLKSFNTRELAEFVVKHTKRPIALSKRWEENIKSAVQFYDVALLRDQTMDQKLDDYLKNSEEKIAALVFGGFHKESIKSILRQKNISYFVVAPKITKISKRHQAFYKQLMAEGYRADLIPASVMRAAVQPKIYHLFAPANAPDNLIRLLQSLDDGSELVAQIQASRQAEEPKKLEADVHKPLAVINGSEQEPLIRSETRDGKKSKSFLRKLSLLAMAGLTAGAIFFNSYLKSEYESFRSSREAITQTITGPAPEYRFAPRYEAENLKNNLETREAYIREFLKWEARFHQPGVGYDANLGTTYDGHAIDFETGELLGGPRPWSAASKEAIHVSLLALAIQGNERAQLFISPEDPAKASAMAKEILTRKITTYENFNARYPGYGGFLPWFLNRTTGIEPAQDWLDRVPALDNGELWWGLIQAQYALKQAGETELAERYDRYLSMLAENAVRIFYDPKAEKIRAEASIKNISASPVDSSQKYSNNVSGYFLNDPYEGELMALAMSVFGKWPDASAVQEIWENKKRVPVTFETPQGSLTVQRGHWFSAHEVIFGVLGAPMLDDPLAKAVFVNGEKARTWNSAMNDIPGLYASTHDVVRGNKSPAYVSELGIPSLATKRVKRKDILTPYAASPVIVADEAAGLAWLHQMLSAPRMQSTAGAVESFNVKGDKIAPLLTWDGKALTVWALAVNEEYAKHGQHPSVPALRERGRYDQVMNFIQTEFSEAFPSGAEAKGISFAYPTKEMAALHPSFPGPETHAGELSNYDILHGTGFQGNGNLFRRHTFNDDILYLPYARGYVWTQITPFDVSANPVLTLSVKTSGGKVSFEIKNSDDQLMTQGKIEIDFPDTNGEYKSFSLNLSDLLITRNKQAGYVIYSDSEASLNMNAASFGSGVPAASEALQPSGLSFRRSETHKEKSQSTVQLWQDATAGLEEVIRNREQILSASFDSKIFKSKSAGANRLKWIFFYHFLKDKPPNAKTLSENYPFFKELDSFLSRMRLSVPEARQQHPDFVRFLGLDDPQPLRTLASYFNIFDHIRKQKEPDIDLQDKDFGNVARVIFDFYFFHYLSVLAVVAVQSHRENPNLVPAELVQKLESLLLLLQDSASSSGLKFTNHVMTLFDYGYSFYGDDEKVFLQREQFINLLDESYRFEHARRSAAHLGRHLKSVLTTLTGEELENQIAVNAMDFAVLIPNLNELFHKYEKIRQRPDTDPEKVRTLAAIRDGFSGIPEEILTDREMLLRIDQEWVSFRYQRKYDRERPLFRPVPPFPREQKLYPSDVSEAVTEFFDWYDRYGKAIADDIEKIFKTPEPGRFSSLALYDVFVSVLMRYMVLNQLLFKKSKYAFDDFLENDLAETPSAEKMKWMRQMDLALKAALESPIAFPLVVSQEYQDQLEESILKRHMAPYNHEQAVEEHHRVLNLLRQQFGDLSKPSFTRSETRLPDGQVRDDENAVREFAAQLDQENYRRVRHPETIHRSSTQFEVFLYPELNLVEKVHTGKSLDASVAMAHERLGGLVADFVYYREGDQIRVFQKNYQSVYFAIRELLDKGNLEEAKDLLRKYFQTSAAIFRRGVSNWDNKIINYAVTPEGNVVLIDIGGLEKSEDVLTESDLDNSSHAYFHLLKKQDLPDELSQAFGKMEREYHLSSLHGAIGYYGNQKENPVPVQWMPTLPRSETRKEQPPNINLAGILRIRKYLDEIPDLNLDEKAKDQLAKWLIANRPFKNSEQFKNALKDSGIQGVRNKRKIIDEAFYLGISRRSFLWSAMATAGVAGLSFWWMKRKEDKKEDREIPADAEQTSTDFEIPAFDPSRAVQGHFFTIFTAHTTANDFSQIEGRLNEIISRTSRNPGRQNYPDLYVIDEGVMDVGLVQSYGGPVLASLSRTEVFDPKYRELLRETFQRVSDLNESGQNSRDRMSLKDRDQTIQEALKSAALPPSMAGFISHFSIWQAQNGVRERSAKLDFDSWYRFWKGALADNQATAAFFTGQTEKFLNEFREYSQLITETTMTRDQAVRAQVAEIRKSDPSANIVFVVGTAHIMDEDILKIDDQSTLYAPEGMKRGDDVRYMGSTGPLQRKYKDHSFESETEERNLLARAFAETLLQNIQPREWEFVKFLELVQKIFDAAKQDGYEPWQAMVQVMELLKDKNVDYRSGVIRSKAFAQALAEKGWIPESDYRQLTSRSETRGMEAYQLSSLIRQSLSDAKNGTMVELVTNNGPFLNLEFIKAHRKEFIQGIKQLRTALVHESVGLRLELGLSYSQMSGVPWFNLEQKDIHGLIAIGKVLSFWDVNPDPRSTEAAAKYKSDSSGVYYPAIKNVNLSALGIDLITEAQEKISKALFGVNFEDIGGTADDKAAFKNLVEIRALVEQGSFSNARQLLQVILNKGQVSKEVQWLEPLIEGLLWVDLRESAISSAMDLLTEIVTLSEIQREWVKQIVLAVFAGHYQNALRSFKDFRSMLSPDQARQNKRPLDSIKENLESLAQSRSEMRLAGEKFNLDLTPMRNSLETKVRVIPAEDPLIRDARNYFQDLPEADLNEIFKSRGIKFPEGVRDNLLAPFKKASFKAALLHEFNQTIEQGKVVAVEVAPQWLKNLTQTDENYQVAWVDQEGRFQILSRFYEYLNNITNEKEKVRIAAALFARFLSQKLLTQTLQQKDVSIDPVITERLQQSSIAVENYVLEEEISSSEDSAVDLRAKGFVYQQMWERNERGQRHARPKFDWGARVHRLQVLLDRLYELRLKLDAQKKVTPEDQIAIHDISASFVIDAPTEQSLQRKTRGKSIKDLERLQKQFQAAYGKVTKRLEAAVKQTSAKEVSFEDLEVAKAKLNSQANAILNKLIKVDFAILRAVMHEKRSIRTILDQLIQHFEYKEKELKWQRVYQEEAKSIVEVFTRGASDEYLKVKALKEVIDKKRKAGTIERIEDRWNQYETYYLTTLKHLLAALMDPASAVTSNPGLWKQKLIDYLKAKNLREAPIAGKSDDQITIDDLAATLYLNKDAADDVLTRIEKWSHEKNVKTQETNIALVRQLVKELVPDQTGFRPGVQRIRYQNLFNFFRSRDHVLRNYDLEQKQAWLAIGFLNDVQMQLRGQAEKGVGGYRKNLIRKDLRQVAHWVKYARVREKTRIRKLIDQSFNNLDLEQFHIVASNMEQALSILESDYLVRIERMSRYVSRHKDSIRSELDSVIGLMQSGIQTNRLGEFRKALRRLERFKRSYTEGYITSEEEPGYRRAKRHITDAISGLDAVSKAGETPSRDSLEPVLRNLYRIAYDIEYKYQTHEQMGEDAVAQMETDIRGKVAAHFTARSEIRVSKEDAALVLDTVNPEEKGEKLRNLILATPELIQAIEGQRRELTALSANPHYVIKINGIPELTISFRLGLLIDTTNGIEYNLRLPFRLQKISQKEFFAAPIYDSDQKLLPLTVADIFRQKGLSRVIEEGLPLERSAEIFYDGKKQIVVFFSTIEEDAFTGIHIDYDSEGYWNTSGIAKLLGVGGLQADPMMNYYKEQGMRHLFQMHFHPNEHIYPSIVDMKTISQTRAPELILSPSGKGRIWIPKDEDRLQRVAENKNFDSSVWSKEDLMSMADELLHSFDLDVAARSEARFIFDGAPQENLLFSLLTQVLGERIVQRDNLGSGLAPPAQIQKPVKSFQRRTREEISRHRKFVKTAREQARTAKGILGRMSESEKAKLVAELALRRPPRKQSIRSLAQNGELREGVGSNIIRSELRIAGGEEEIFDEAALFEGATIRVAEVEDIPQLREFVEAQNLPRVPAFYVELPPRAIPYMYAIKQGSRTATAFHDTAAARSEFRSVADSARNIGIIYAAAPAQLIHEYGHQVAQTRTIAPAIGYVARSQNEAELLEELANYRAQYMKLNTPFKYSSGARANVLSYANSQKQKDILNAVMNVIDRIDGIFPQNLVTHLLLRARSLDEILSWDKDEKGIRLSDEALVEKFYPHSSFEEMKRFQQAGFDPDQKALLDIQEGWRNGDWYRDEGTDEQRQEYTQQWLLGAAQYLLGKGGRAILLLKRMLQEAREDSFTATAKAYAVSALEASPFYREQLNRHFFRSGPATGGRHTSLGLDVRRSEARDEEPQIKAEEFSEDQIKEKLLRLKNEFLRAVTANKEFSWSYGEQEVQARMEAEEYDEDRGSINVIIYPTQEEIQKDEKLRMLNKLDPKHRIGFKAGAFGMFEMYFIWYKGSPKLLFWDRQPTVGYKELIDANSVKTRRRYKPWVKGAMLKIVQIGQSIGIQEFRAIPYEAILRKHGQSSPLWSQYYGFTEDFPDETAAHAYILKEQEKIWEPIEGFDTEPWLIAVLPSMVFKIVNAEALVKSLGLNRSLQSEINKTSETRSESRGGSTAFQVDRLYKTKATNTYRLILHKDGQIMKILRIPAPKQGIIEVVRESERELLPQLQKGEIVLADDKEEAAVRSKDEVRAFLQMIEIMKAKNMFERTTTTVIRDILIGQEYIRKARELLVIFFKAEKLNIGEVPDYYQRVMRRWKELVEEEKRVVPEHLDLAKAIHVYLVDQMYRLNTFLLKKFQEEIDQHVARNNITGADRLAGELKRLALRIKPFPGETFDEGIQLLSQNPEGYVLRQAQKTFFQRLPLALAPGLKNLENLAHAAASAIQANHVEDAVVALRQGQNEKSYLQQTLQAEIRAVKYQKPLTVEGVLPQAAQTFLKLEEALQALRGVVEQEFVIAKQEKDLKAQGHQSLGEFDVARFIQRLELLRRNGFEQMAADFTARFNASSQPRSEMRDEERVAQYKALEEKSLKIAALTTPDENGEFTDTEKSAEALILLNDVIKIFESFDKETQTSEWAGWILSYLVHIGAILYSQGSDAASEVIQQAQAFAERYKDILPKDERLESNLQELLLLVEPAEEETAESNVVEAPTGRPLRHDAEQSFVQANRAREQRRFAEANDLYKTAFQQVDERLVAHPEDKGAVNLSQRIRKIWATTLNQLGASFKQSPKDDYGIQYHQQALELLEAVLLEVPKDPMAIGQKRAAFNGLGGSFNNKGNDAGKARDQNASIGYYEQSLNYFRQAIALEANNKVAFDQLGSMLTKLGKSYGYRGFLLAQSKKYEDSIRENEKSVTLLNEALSMGLKNPDIIEYKAKSLGGLGTVKFDQAEALRRAHQMEEAEKKYREAVGHLTEAIEGHPKFTLISNYLVNSYVGLGLVLNYRADRLRQSGHHQNAVPLYEAAINSFDRAFEFEPDSVVAHDQKEKAIRGLDLSRRGVTSPASPTTLTPSAPSQVIEPGKGWDKIFEEAQKMLKAGNSQQALSLGKQAYEALDQTDTSKKGDKKNRVRKFIQGIDPAWRPGSSQQPETRSESRGMDSSVIIHLPMDVNFVMDPDTIDHLDEKQWLELIGLKLVNEEKLHILIRTETADHLSARVEELRKLKNVYEGQWHPALPQNAMTIYFSEFGHEHPSRVLGERLRKMIETQKGQNYFGVYSGAFGTALLYALKEGMLEGLDKREGLYFDPNGIYTEQVLASLFNSYEVISQAA